MKKIEKASIIKSAGTKEKIIKEYFGKVNSGDTQASIAIMDCPGGWTEPGQRPEFDEYTVVTEGVLHIKMEKEEFEVKAGEAVMISKGEWVQYSTPNEEGAKYVSVCIPAFSVEGVHRDS